MIKNMKKKIELSVKKAKELYQSTPELREILEENFTKRELGIDDFPKSWSDLDYVEGYFLKSNSEVYSTPNPIMTISWNKCVFPTRLDAKKSLAEAQLRQLAKEINDGQTEEEWIDWNNDVRVKYYAYCNYDRSNFFISNDSDCHQGGIYFKRREDLERSLKEHKDLWLQYFKIN